MARPRSSYNIPAGVDVDLPGDPYHALIAAIVQRAVQDAQGHMPTRGTPFPQRAQEDARQWLLAGQEAADLLMLAGLDAEVVLGRVRQRLDVR